MLNSLVHLRRRSAKGEETIEALEMLEGRIHAIRAVHELLDRAGEIDWVQAGALIEELCTQLDGSLTRDNIRIENELLDVKLHVRDATPLSLMINELITNTLKHAFPDDRDGRVHVALQKNGEDKLEVRVADNGRGIVDGGQTGSGSQIIQALAKQIGGKLDRHSDEEGTKWTFVFPYRQQERREPVEVTLGMPDTES
ncbi:sensor histidine kinase [Sphingomicrobium sp. XHP0235]|uniref:sensor histidine kinase n=1 Tax=Sphingomicrobium aquimarinum TaxID=3133971 RepID=UPI0031FEE785